MTEVHPERKRRPPPLLAEPRLELETAVEAMRRMLDQTFAEVTGWPAVRTRDILSPVVGDVWSPLIDIEETDDAYLLEAELPGVEREDVDIELVGNELTVTGEVKEKERSGVLRKATRRSGRFAYRVTLPEPVDGAGVEATLAQGVLKVRVPKAERSQRRKIELTAS